MNDRHAISPYPVRMPGELRKRLDESAREGSRSLHAEIISRLEESFASPNTKQMGMGELADLLIEMGREKGLSVEVTISQPNEQEPVSESSVESLNRFFQAETEAQSRDPGLRRETERSFMSSLMELIKEYNVSERILVPPDDAKPQPNTGPKPRKKFPKE